MPWEPYEKWSPEAKAAHNKDVEEFNKNWSVSDEKNRRERVCNKLTEVEQSQPKINIGTSTIQSNNATPTPASSSKNNKQAKM